MEKIFDDKKIADFDKLKNILFLNGGNFFENFNGR